jgi:hypothetical protein
VIYRPLSFYLTPPLLRLGVPILGVTLSSAVIAALMLWVAWLDAPNAYLIIAALGFTFHVLDCIDGNMARTTDRASRVGALADATIDMCFWCALFVCLGKLVENGGGGILGDRSVEFALGIAIVVLINRVMRDGYALQSQDDAYFRAEIPEKLSLGDKAMIAVVGLEGTYVFWIALGGYFGVLDWVLVGVAVYVVLIFIGAIGITFSKAAASDRTTSSSDPR